MIHALRSCVPLGMCGLMLLASCGERPLPDPPPKSVPTQQDLIAFHRERAILLETLQEIAELLDGLPVPVQRAFLMAQLDGLSQAEIAASLKISVTTVKRYLIRAGTQCYFAIAAP